MTMASSNITRIPANVAAPNTAEQWAQDVLKFLGWPTTPSNQKALIAWSNYESGRTANDPNFWNYRNPLSTSQGEPGSTPFNSSGIQSYPNWYESFEATVSMLSQSNDTSIATAFKGGDAFSTLPAALANAQWAGTSPAANQAYSQTIASYFKAQGANVFSSSGAGGVTPIGAGQVSNPFTGNIGGDLLTVLAVVGQFLGGVLLLVLGFVTLYVRAMPELSWFMLGAAATLIWSAIRVENSVCVIETAVSGETKSCKLAWSQVGFSWSALVGDTFGQLIP